MKVYSIKQVSMTRNYHNHTLQTNPRHGEDEQQNTNSHKAPGRQLKLSNQLSLPHQADYKTRVTQSNGYKNKPQTQIPPTNNGATINNESTTEPLPSNRRQPKPPEGGGGGGGLMQFNGKTIFLLKQMLVYVDILKN